MGELFCTIVAAVTILVMGQIIIKFFIEPIHKQKEVIGEIVDALDYYANVYFSAALSKQEELQEASKRFRQLSTMLKAKTHLIPRHVLLSRLGFVHKYSEIFDICSELMGLSNSCRHFDHGVLANPEHASKHADRIRRILGVP